MTKPRKFAHVVLRTPHFDAMKQWWSTVLEAEVRFADEMVAFMSYDDEHHRLALINMPGLAERNPSCAGVEHVAYTYASLDDLFANYTRLKQLGIEPYWTIHHGGTLSSYYRDPDGNQVELQIDAMSRAETDEFMRSPLFAANPIGIEVDFDDLLARYESGEPADSVIAYPAGTSA